MTISGGINVENFNISGLTVVTNPYVYLSGDSNTVNILNPVELSGTSSVSISGVPTVTISGVVQTNISSTPITISGPISLDPANLGAFGRQRTAQPFTLFDMNSILGRDPIRMVEDISGSATIAGHSNSYVLMTVPATNGDRAIYQSREYIPYQPGKSRLAYMTGVLIGDSNASNAVSRIGSFDGENGHFFMFSNGN